MLTIKGERPLLRAAPLGRLAAELASGLDDGLVLVHGAGSFGHPQAKRAFASDPPDPMGLAGTHRAVATLDLRLIEKLHDQQIPAVAFAGNALGRARKGELVSFDASVFEEALAAGLVPVTHGDVLVDEDDGFAVVSGDAFMVELARKLEPDRAIFVTDVDGIYDRDPNDHDDATLLEELSDPSEVAAGGSAGVDVTGGMGGKLEAMLAVSEHAECRVINGLVEGRLAEALKGGDVLGTRIRRS